jgi:hypothetical protein
MDGDLFSGLDSIGRIIDDDEDDIRPNWPENDGYVITADGAGGDEENDIRRSEWNESAFGADSHGTGHGDKYSYAGKLQKIAHVLHYCSIGILGLFVLQVRRLTCSITIDRMLMIHDNYAFDIPLAFSCA